MNDETGRRSRLAVSPIASQIAGSSFHLSSNNGPNGAEPTRVVPVLVPYNSPDLAAFFHFLQRKRRRKAGTV